jgi:hypothetical protein
MAKLHNMRKSKESDRTIIWYFLHDQASIVIVYLVAPNMSFGAVKYLEQI